MSEVNIKYLKDEDGSVISPVTSTDSVFTNNKIPITEYIEDSGWITATLTDDFTTYSSSQVTFTVQYRKIGKIVHIQGVVNPVNKITASSTITVIFTLPTRL